MAGVVKFAVFDSSDGASSLSHTANSHFRLRDKLGWGPGIMNVDRSKPKGMHWRTFVWLKAEHDALIGEYLAGITQRFEAMESFGE